MKVFDENIQDFSPYNALYWAPRFKFQKTVSVQTANCSKGLKRFQTMN